MENNGTSKTALGIGQNIEGLFCYFLGFITGIIFLVLEKENRFVRFHAMQSVATFLPLFVISIAISVVFGIIPLIGWLIAGLLLSVITILAIVLWLLLMYKAFIGERYKLPGVGDFAEKQINI